MEFLNHLPWGTPGLFFCEHLGWDCFMAGDTKWQNCA